MEYSIEVGEASICLALSSLIPWAEDGPKAVNKRAMRRREAVLKKIP